MDENKWFDQPNDRSDMPVSQSATIGIYWTSKYLFVTLWFIVAPPGLLVSQQQYVSYVNYAN